MSTKLIVSCISGVGAIGGVAAGGYYLLNKESEKSQEASNTHNQQEQQAKETQVANPKKTLKDALSGADFIALDTAGRGDDTDWKKLIKKHKGSEVTKKINIEGGLIDGTKDSDAANIQKFQKACSDLFAKTENYEDDKETARNWCNKESKLIKD